MVYLSFYPGTAMKTIYGIIILVSRSRLPFTNAFGYQRGPVESPWSIPVSSLEYRLGSRFKPRGLIPAEIQWKCVYLTSEGIGLGSI
ncbi:uncharacterized protein Bfra_007700 [Botrytis fragariae]|uniref:Uncharacterized protein n=1 Tax=Botrytis fragariae TaxID=1964551 RepID=A0A8H6EG96_9HELO|nr:uncharacterized protein Bfra_007700 [Botrytis fragariae]KAF5871187.1 hypothetical protein Bfra_007700 [Botrytis fragariae]